MTPRALGIIGFEADHINIWLFKVLGRVKLSSYLVLSSVLSNKAFNSFWNFSCGVKGAKYTQIGMLYSKQ